MTRLSHRYLKTLKICGWSPKQKEALIHFLSLLHRLPQLDVLDFEGLGGSRRFFANVTAQQTQSLSYFRATGTSPIIASILASGAIAPRKVAIIANLPTSSNNENMRKILNALMTALPTIVWNSITSMTIRLPVEEDYTARLPTPSVY